MNANVLMAIVCLLSMFGFGLQTNSSSQLLLDTLKGSSQNQAGHTNKQPTLMTANRYVKENKKFQELYAKWVSDYLEDVSLMSHMSVDDLKLIYNLTVHRYDRNFGNHTNITYGNTACNQTELENTEYVTDACPWHHELRLRSNMYPHMRVNAICNCQGGCLANIPGYDSSYSRCEQVFTYMPAMIKTLSVTGDPQWTFLIEQVPTSCVCRLRTKIYN